MIETGKISNLQMSIMMYHMIMATAALLVPTISAIHAGRDMWLSPLWASLAGFITVIVACLLGRMYANQTLIQYSESILGRIAGKIVGLLFLMFYIHTCGIIVREYGEFVTATLLQRTPIIVPIAAMLLVCAFAVSGGIEVVARAAQFIGPAVIILLFLLIAMLIPDLRPVNMFPVMEQGVMPSIAGSLPLQGTFSELLLIAFFLPYLNKQDRALRWGIVTVIGISITMVATYMAVLFLYGNIADNVIYPVLLSARYISIAEFFEHIEAIVISIWVAGTFIKVSILLYAVTTGTAQWLNIQNHRRLLPPFIFLLVVMGIWTSPNAQVLFMFLKTSMPYYFVAIQVVLPIFLLIAAIIRQKLQSNKGAAMQ